MTCGLCPITVKKSLEKVPGVTDAKVDFDKKTATVKFDADKVNTSARPCGPILLRLLMSGLDL